MELVSQSNLVYSCLRVNKVIYRALTTPLVEYTKRFFLRTTLDLHYLFLFPVET